MWTKKYVYRDNGFQSYNFSLNLDLFDCSIDANFIFVDWISRTRALEITICYTVNDFYWFLYKFIVFNENNNFIYSDLLGERTFIGFYCTWIYQLLAGSFFLFVITFSVLFPIGMCIYVHAIINDLKATIKKLDCDPPSNQKSNKKCHSKKTSSWTIYVDAINLHNDIIG